MSELIPILGITTGVVIPLAVFVWLYQDDKNKRQVALEIAKHLDEPVKFEDLLSVFDERKREPVDYSRGGVITIFVGVGIYLLGITAMGRFFEGIGLLVGAIGVELLAAGYFFPSTGEEITDAVEKFEQK